MNPLKEMARTTVTVGQETLTLITQPVTPMTMPRQAPPTPEGWQPGPPDFVGVGAARCGTTWWWSLISQHERYAQAGARKELHFFDHYMGVEDVDPLEYHRYFPKPPGEGMFAGEWTPRYMYDFWTPPMLSRIAPETKILVLLRDPVQRVLSNLALIRSRNIALSHSLLHQQIARGLYAQQLLMLFQHFSPEQVLVMQYEQCVREPVAQVRRTFEFLGVDPDGWRPERPPTEKVNASRAEKPVFSPQTLDGMELAFQSDLSLLFGLVPTLDPDLWPTAARAAGLHRPVLAATAGSGR